MATRLASLEDIPEGKGIVVKTDEGKEIALFKLGGEIYALENLCPHMGGPLGEGELEGSCLTCPWHGWQFNVRTGACENMPGDDASKIEVFVRDGGVYLKDG